MRFLPTCLALAVLASAAAPVCAGAKHHHHSPGHHSSRPSAADAREAEIQAQHRIRLAGKEKKEWRQHLAKLRSLPHAERVAEKHKEKRWQREHNEKVAAMQAAAEYESVPHSGRRSWPAAITTPKHWSPRSRSRA